MGFEANVEVSSSECFIDEVGSTLSANFNAHG